MTMAGTPQKREAIKKAQDALSQYNPELVKAQCIIAMLPVIRNKCATMDEAFDMAISEGERFAGRLLERVDLTPPV